MQGLLKKLNVNKIFIVNRSELEDRFDAQFYKEGFEFSNFIKLHKIAKISGGKRLPEGYDFSNEQTNYRYLRVGDVNWDGTLNYQNFKYLSKEVYTILKRYEIFKNDLLIAIVGATVGKVSILDIETNENIILTENCAKITLKDSSVLPKYLFILLQSPIIQKQIQLNYIQTTLPKLGLDRVSSLYIPPIPSLEIQREIVALFSTAFKIKQKKEVESKRLLNNIDSFILKELGISLQEQNNTLTNRVFTITFSQLVGKRFDPFYFKYLGANMRSSLYKEVSLKSIASIGKGQSITKDKVSDGVYPVIAGGQSSPYNHNAYNQDSNVITVSASGAYAGFVWFHNQKIFASDCIVIRSKKESEVSTEFIYNVLKSKQTEIYRMQQGAGQPHVYSKDLEKLSIPLPSISKQNEINNYIKDLYTQINELNKDAINILEEAKQKIEKKIIPKSAI